MRQHTTGTEARPRRWRRKLLLAAAPVAALVLAGVGLMPSASAATTYLQYNGGAKGTFTQKPTVYLVFYGSQWGSTSAGGSARTSAEGFLKGLGTGGERWSTVLTQYCTGVAKGTRTCPSSAKHIPYPTGGGVFGGTWVDLSKRAPANPGDDLITEARSAAAHFHATLSHSIFAIYSPSGTSAGGGYAWHTTTSDGYNVINMPYGWTDTTVLSHEYAETLTDVSGGWTTADLSSEVADLCGPAGQLKLPTGSFNITSLWSNKANACVTSG